MAPPGSTARPIPAPTSHRSGERPMSANLDPDQRRALDLFLDGQISAGALSERLERARAAHPDGSLLAAGPEMAATATRPAARPRSAVRKVPARALAAPGAVLALLLVGGVCAWAGATALAGSVPRAHRQAKQSASATRPARHRPRLSSTHRAKTTAFTASASSAQASAPAQSTVHMSTSASNKADAHARGKSAAHHDQAPAGHRRDGGAFGPGHGDRSTSHSKAAGPSDGPQSPPGKTGGAPPGQGDGSAGGGSPNPSGPSGTQSGGPQTSSSGSGQSTTSGSSPS